MKAQVENGPGGSQHNADLVERIKAGDQQAQEEVFRSYRQGVTAILRKHGAPEDIIEDLFQETLVIVLHSIKQGVVRHPNRLPGYICNVAKHRWWKFLNKELRMQGAAGTKYAESSCGPRQHEDLLRKQEIQVVRRVLDELTMDRDREILIRYYLLEEDKEEICAALGLSSIHFNRVLYRALQRFKELFDAATSRKTG